MEKQKVSSTADKLIGFPVERLLKSAIRKIKFKSGYTEYYQPDPVYTYGDKLYLSGGRILSCIVIEMGEDSLLVDIPAADVFRWIRADSVLSVKSRSGYITVYREDAQNIPAPTETEQTKALQSIDSTAAMQKLISRFSQSSIVEELAKSKGDYDDIKSLFNRVISDDKFSDPSYDSVKREIILEYCRLFDESYFSGKTEKGLPQGKGILYMPDQVIQQGEFKNGKLNGRGKIIRNGTLEKEGIFSNGDLNGEGIFIFPNGMIAKGFFIDNLITGNGEKRLKTGAYEKGYYFKGRLDGLGERYFDNGNYFKGSFLNGRYNGNGTYWWQDHGCSYEGSFVNGKRNGEGELKLKDGTVITGSWVEDELNGQIVLRKPGKKSGEFNKAIWEVKDGKVISKPLKNSDVSPKEKLLFLKMTGF